MSESVRRGIDTLSYSAPTTSRALSVPIRCPAIFASLHRAERASIEERAESARRSGPTHRFSVKAVCERAAEVTVASALRALARLGHQPLLLALCVPPTQRLGRAADRLRDLLANSGPDFGQEGADHPADLRSEPADN